MRRAHTRRRRIAAISALLGPMMVAATAFAAPAAPVAPNPAAFLADPSGAAVTPGMFGARCDSTGSSSTGSDDTAVFQQAIDLAEATGRRLRLPGAPTMCRITAPLMIRRHLLVEGDFCQPVTLNDGRRPTPGIGSWLYLDHPGLGLVIGDGTRTQVTGVVLRDLCIIRNQPEPVAGSAWSPTPNDFDIDFRQDDLAIENVTLLNATKGVRSHGRLHVEGLFGQPMAVGLELDDTHDTTVVQDVHWWPYWMDNHAVEAFTQAHLEAFVLGRVDNPMFSNISAVTPHDCFHIVPGVGGTLNKFHGQNLDCDLFGGAAWFVDGTVGATWQITNFTGQGDDQLHSRSLVQVGGKGNFGTFVNVRGTLMGRDGVVVTGAGNDVTFLNLRLERWGQAAAAPAVNVARDNAVTIVGSFQPAGPPVGGTAFGGDGHIYQSESVDRGGGASKATPPAP